MWETITVYIKYSHVDLLVLVEYEWQSLVKSLLELSTLFIWGIPDTERSGACMQVGHTCFLRNCSSFWWQTGFLRLPSYQSKVTEVIFSQGRRWYTLPYYWLTSLLQGLQQNYSWFRAEEFETKRMVLYHSETPCSHKPHLLQSVHKLTSLHLEPSHFYLQPSRKPDPETTFCLEA